MISLQLMSSTREVFAPAPFLSSGWWRDNSVILTASIGMGHMRAAQAIAEELGHGKLEDGPNVIDALDYMPTFAPTVYRSGYLKLAEKAPLVLGKIYELSDSPSAVDGMALTIDRMMVSRLQKFLCRLQPEVVFSTHFLTSRVVGALKAADKLNSSLIQIVTDFDAHAYWLVKEADQFCVAGAPAKDRLIEFGIDPRRIIISGIPIAHAFRILEPREQARQRLKLSNKSPVVILTLGGLGSAPYLEFVKGLAKASSEVQFVIVCGKNKIALEQTNRFLSSLPESNSSRFRILGFTTEMATYMAAADILIGKPGGLTSSEALATGLPLILVQPIPGQEERNADYLLENGAAVRCRYPEQLGMKVDEMLGNARTLEIRALAAKDLGNLQASTTVIERGKFEAIRLDLISMSEQFRSVPQIIKEVCTSKTKGTVIFDLDNTCLIGDIGEAVFEKLALRQELSRLTQIEKALVNESGLADNRSEEFSPKELYNQLLMAAKDSERRDEILALTYEWMSRTLAGLSIAEVRQVTSEVWSERKLKINSDTLDCMADVISAGSKVVIVSASQQIIVSWIVENAINPALRKRNSSSIIDPKDVWGMQNTLLDGRGCKDALLNQVDSEQVISSDLLSPTPTYQGKAQLLISNGYHEPLLVAGDSSNDLAMAALSKAVLWVVEQGNAGKLMDFRDFVIRNKRVKFALL